MRLDDRVLLQLIVDQDSLNGKQQQRDNSLLTYTWTQCTSCWKYTASVLRKLYKSSLHRLWYRTSQIYRIVDKMNTECISSGSSQRALKDDVQLPITLEARRLLWTLCNIYTSSILRLTVGRCRIEAFRRPLYRI